VTGTDPGMSVGFFLLKHFLNFILFYEKYGDSI
jgi:hypothetical protein